MKQMLQSVKEIVGILIVMTLSVLTVSAQRPEIKAVDKVSGSTAETVTLTGSSFGTNASKLAVSFGAVTGSIVSVTDQLMQVTVPPGTTYNTIAVTNIPDRLIGYAPSQFLLSFSGIHPFDINNLGTQLNFFAEKGLYDLCHCDFDEDGKADIAAANSDDNSISIFKNTSTGPGNITFTKMAFPVGVPTLHVKCGDLNGDGKKDLVITDGGTGNSDKIFVLQNTSTGPGVFTFSAQTITVSGRKTGKVEISDLDLDGKPELIITDQGTNNIAILINQSLPATITFNPVPVTINIPEAVTTDGLEVADLNGDLKPEIIVSQFQTANSNLFILPNKNNPGSFSFGESIKIVVGGNVRRIKVGDLDGDKKPDITVTQALGQSVSIFLNTGAGSAITFGAPKVIKFDIGFTSWGMDFGDLDGDGKTDIVVASSFTLKSLVILNNESTPGNLSFLTKPVATASINRHVQVGDLDGDGKPEISFTSIDNSSGTVSNVSVLRNKSCVVPKIEPSTTPLRLCDGLLPYKLKATVTRGAYYEWRKDGVALSCGINQNTFDITTTSGSGKYTVRILAEGATCNSTPVNTCDQESEGIDVVIVTGAAVTPVINPVAPLCLDGTLALSVAAPDGLTTYQWSGPAGFTATGPSVSLANFKLENAGVYTVEAIKGTCIQGSGTRAVEVIDVPSFQISVPVSPVICAGDASKILSVTPPSALFTYNWFKDGTAVASNQTTYTVTSVNTSSGNYVVKAIGCANVETPAVKIQVVTVPTAAFAPSSFAACVGQKVTFTNQSTFDNQATVFYAWNFGDGNTSTEESPTHIYSTANAGYTPSLMVSYEGGACPNSKSSPTPIVVTPATRPVIINPETAGKFDFCEGQSITLAITGTFTEIVWSTGQKDVTSIEVSSSNNYFVDAKDANGCALSSETKVVTTIPSPEVMITAEPPQINEGETSQLNASGLDNYTWEPADLIDGSAAVANPIVRPLITTTFTVTGTASGNQCPGVGTIQVKVLGEAIVNKLAPANMFSPNNSGPVETESWVVGSILDYPQCGVTVYDDKGVKVFSAKPYQNDWNGTYNGKRLPDGVYFYVIRCDGEENTPRTGSITLLR